jgi:hypothetical protein
MKRLMMILVALLWGVGLTTVTAQSVMSDTLVSIFFAHDRYGLRSEAVKVDSVARLLREDTGAVALQGYASNVGTVKYNRRLVAKRLLTVKKALMRRGIASKRIFPIINNGIDKANAAKYARRVDMLFAVPVTEEPADNLSLDSAANLSSSPDSTAPDSVANFSSFISHLSSTTDSVAFDSTANFSSFISHLSSSSCPRLALRTNLLYDLVVVPNVGVEWFANEHWSVAANVMYIWTKNDMRHRYWRLFSTDVEGRYWLRPQTCDVRTGHHFGLYAGFYRYDFEFGGEGWMGDANYGVGVSYGYALRLFPKWKERFTLDMSIGLGYLGGTHKEYIPDAGCYVWQRTMRHHLFIPTKAEITLVWYPRWSLFNKKGGAQ